ncbi:DUF4157 domain-containing protein [Phormidium sp. CLA17]|nr:DUF4157 domain-containing protein [Leptolyngbya sp. Cla-17]
MKPMADRIQRVDMPEEDELQMQPMVDQIQRVDMPEEDELQMQPMADQIQRVDMPEEDELQMQPMVDQVQRVDMPEEEELQMKPMADQIQREDMPEEEELQMKSMVQRQAGGEAVTASANLESSIQQARSGGQPLADPIRQPMEQAFGADFSGVKVHTDTQSDQLNRSIQAKAFTTGQDVFFRQGAYEPGSRGGQELIAHELTHVVQQTGSPATLQRDYDTSQNLPTSASLTTEFQSKKQMGRAKPWRFGKANAELKKVFGVLDEYQSYLNAYGVIGPAEFEVEDQVENLQRSLNGVVATVGRYVRKRPEGKKTPTVQALGTLATDVLKKLTVVGSNPTKYLGVAWKRMLVVSGGDLTEFQQNIDVVPGHVSEFEADETAINKGVKQLDPEIAAAIEKTNKGIKTGKNEQGEPVNIRQVGGMVGHNGGLSGAYLVPDGFFKPFLQSPVRNNSGLAAGYQNFREVLAYEISKYIKGLFKDLGIDQDLGVVKTSFAALSSEKFAEGGKSWNKKMTQAGAKAVPEAEMPEQVGIWQERLDIDGTIKDHHYVENENTKKQVQQIAFFDLMTGNYDRHSGNLVFDKGGNLRPIDHGEILPNFALYKEHNWEGHEGEGGIESKFAWTKTKASHKGFSEDFKKLAEAIDPGTVVSDLKRIAAQTSLALGLEKLSHRGISEESWQIMHLHLVALKEGIMAGLSPLQLAMIFAKGMSATREDQGEMYKTMVKLDEELPIRQNDRTQSREFTRKELAEAEEKVKQAIQNGKERLHHYQPK